MTDADATAARDYTRDAFALMRMLKANQSADAQTLLDSYTNNVDQSGLSGTLVTVALALTAYVDHLGKDLAAYKPDYPITNSDDVLASIELLLSPPANGKAGKDNGRAEPISYL